MKELCTVVVFGNLSSLDKRTGKLKLSLDGKMRAIAAGELYEEGLTRRIIVSGGKTSGEGSPSEAEMMSNYLIRHFLTPEGIITKEDKSIDTTENIERIKELLEKEKIEERVIMLSNQYHIKRIKKLSAISGLSADAINAESVLLKRSKHYRLFLKRYSGSCEMIIKKIKETILRGLLIINPAGNIPRKIAERTRK